MDGDGDRAAAVGHLGVMATREAVTPAPHVGITFLAFTGLYLILGSVLAVLLRRSGATGDGAWLMQLQP